MVKYSIVVSTMEGNLEYLTQCLQSIKDYTEGTYEVILVVNGENPQATALAGVYGAKIVQVEEPVHFSAAYNLGLAEAEGEFLVALNDDTIVTPNWNVKMAQCMLNYSKRHDMPEVAMVGPVSNNVGGPQAIPPAIAQRINPMNCQSAAEEIEASNHDVWIPTAFLSGFCLMISRKFYDQNSPEFFDERLKNGAEDNLIALKALFSGHALVIAGDTFVFHYGSKTLTRVDPKGGRGVRNLFDYYKIANEEVVPKETKVASACRVRLLNDDHVRIFLQGVEQQVGLGDILLLVNDRSEIWPEDEIMEIADAAGVPVRIHAFQRGHDEIRDRAKLLEMAVEEGCNWFLSWDADEIFEDKFTKEYLDRLVHPPNPSVMSYSFHWYTFWDEAGEMWRVDSTFGVMYGARLARILPNYGVMKSESGLHMGNVPTVNLAFGSRISSVRIKHYGYQTPAERQRKYDFYESIDTVKDPKEIGNVDYSHLIPGVYQVAQWQEDSTVTVGTCVRNEEIRLHNFLDSLWAFADHMVFTDTGSTDRTVELLEYFGATVLDYEEETGEAWDPERPDFASARNTVIGRVEDKWFWHHDIDEHLQSDGKIAPLAMIRRMLDKPGIDGYQFQFYNLTPGGPASHSQATRLVKDPVRFYYTGYTHETMDEAAQDKAIAIAPVDAVHSGWLVDDERAKEKLKIYLRGNLRMVQDYPEDPRGWFNSGLHLLDIEATNAAMKFIEQALVRKPEFAAARKELITQGAQQLYLQAQSLQSVTPPGHLFHEFARLVQQQVQDIKADNSLMKRAPEHVIEVLSEPEFAQTRALVERFDHIDFGGDHAADNTETEIIPSGTPIISPPDSGANV